ncbi:MAG: T9SS type A sorting domain-containing protein [Bacteroidota bacterium]|nr:T9SS type A sorting domain-containing protein [Bacteroidota bacterium]
MKTSLPPAKIKNCILGVIILSLLNVAVKAQTYTTNANGAWSSASTWVGGVVPDATNIPRTAVINIRNTVTYTGSDIVNNGTINIYNPLGIPPRLIVANSINFTNALTGKLYITGGEYQQYRFAGGGQSGANQSGNFTNDGGYILVNSSYLEVAQKWTNQKTGIVVFKNSSLVTGKDYNTKDAAIDTLSYTSVSVGWQNGASFTEEGLSVYFQGFRAEIASTDGDFDINGKVIANGGIDYITLTNDFTGVTSNGKITIDKKIVTTTGLALGAYCVSQPSSYKPNGRVSGPQVADCSLTYFPATLNGATAATRMNFSLDPVLISGTDKQAGAKYLYSAIAPGVDATLSIDSIVGGATINSVDDNTGTYGGFPEAFQPIITSGNSVGSSYAVFSFNYLITGTSVPLSLDTFSLTAIDIDGTSSLKEFDQISAGPGAIASAVSNNPVVKITQVSPGTFMGINADGSTVNGVDTMSLINMFTVKNTKVSSFSAKLGMQTSSAQTSLRLFSLYTKGFNYPSFSVLPVKLISFDAALNNNNVDLKWTTAMEQNISHFKLQRSNDGKNFSDAGIVFPNEAPTQYANYTFNDDVSSVHATILYYRLTTVDMDGKIQYSPIRIIRISKQSDNNLIVTTYPNPVANELHVTIPALWQNRKVSYKLFNANGQLSIRTDNENSSQTESINLYNLTSGIYIVEVSCEGQTTQQKIIKL